MPRKTRRVWYILRREPYYHKLQYSKTPKFDPAAAIFGVVIGAFVAYLTLSTVGSAGADLSDLTVLMWYLFIFYHIIKTWIFLKKNAKPRYPNSLRLAFVFFIEIASMIVLPAETKVDVKKKKNAISCFMHIN